MPQKGLKKGDGAWGSGKNFPQKCFPASPKNYLLRLGANQDQTGDADSQGKNLDRTDLFFQKQNA